MRRFLSIAVALISLDLVVSAQAPSSDRVLTHREQAAAQYRWISTRFETLLPSLMRREGIDMWIVVSREYNDDPVFRSMAPVTTYSSRRRTILVFFDRGSGNGGPTINRACPGAATTSSGRTHGTRSS